MQFEREGKEENIVVVIRTCNRHMRLCAMSSDAERFPLKFFLSQMERFHDAL